MKELSNLEYSENSVSTMDEFYLVLQHPTQ